MRIAETVYKALHDILDVKPRASCKACKEVKQLASNALLNVRERLIMEGELRAGLVSEDPSIEEPDVIDDDDRPPSRGSIGGQP